MDYSMSESSPVSWSLLIFLSLKSVTLSNHLIFFHPLLLSSVFPSIRDFYSELSLCIRWPKYWSFSISPSNEYWGLILFRIVWFELLIVQGTPGVSSKTTVQKHQVFGAQPSLWSSCHIHTWLLEKLWLWLYRPFLVKWCLCFFFNMLSRFVIACLPRSRRLLISWLQSPSTVILELKKIKAVTASTFSSSVCHEVMRPEAVFFVFWMLSFKPAFSLSSFPLIKKL